MAFSQAAKRSATSLRDLLQHGEIIRGRAANSARNAASKRFGALGEFRQDGEAGDGLQFGQHLAHQLAQCLLLVRARLQPFGLLAQFAIDALAQQRQRLRGDGGLAAGGQCFHGT